MDSAYVEDQYKLSYPDHVEHHWWHLARHAVIFYELKKVIEKDSCLLEIGCGRGIVRWSRKIGQVAKVYSTG